jgi:hypothetical protein
MSYNLKTDLHGKVNNMPHFRTEALLPVFETVVNSIQAIQERDDNIERGKIVITIKRQVTLFEKSDFAPNTEIIGFEIQDNGVGFNDANLDSFKTSDTTYKLAKGCKGIGRFSWLKAFERAEIVSVFKKDNTKILRTIDFSLEKGIVESTSYDTLELQQRTTVKLIGFKDEYRTQASAYKKTEKIAQRILEHCLSFFITGTAPKIFVQDDQDNTINFDLELMFQEIKGTMVSENFEILGQTFSLSHIKLYSTYSKMHNLVLCASYRGVQSKKISTALGVSAEFDENDKKFIYAAYLSSPYLDQHVNLGRLSFDIPEDTPLLDNVEQDTDENECQSEAILPSISMKTIENEVVERSKKFLEDQLQQLQKRKVEKVDEYIAKENPTLRYVPHYSPDVYNEIQPNTSSEKIGEILYQYKGKAEYEIKKRSHELLKKQVDSFEEIKEEMTKVEEHLEGFQKDQLASYIISRKLIIDLLDKKLKLNNDGKYANEDIIHDIIFPRKTTTDQIPFENHNLWLIDERLAFHSFATSDLPLDDITNSESARRPDILVFSEVAPDRTVWSVSIIEFKKPQRDDKKITDQLYDYVRLVQNKKIKTYTGRILQVIETTKFYCYAICDIADKIIEVMDEQEFSKLKDGLGYYKYNERLNTHIEIIAFDKIVTDATLRHKIFFEKLGINNI